MAKRRRAAELTVPTQLIQDTGLSIRGFSAKNEPVCTLVIGASGIDVYRPKAKKPIRTVQWEELIPLAESTLS